MVDLADRRILGDEFLLLVPELGDVAAHHDRPDPVSAVTDRDGAERDGDAAGLHVGAPRRTPRDDERERLVDDELAAEEPRHHVGERLPLELVVEAHAVERRQCVRAGEGRDPVDVEPDQAVRGTWGTAARAGWCAEVGEIARGDHLEELFGALVEREFLPAGGARCAEVRVPCDHGDGLDRECCPRDREPAHHRHGAYARGHLLVPVGCGRVDDRRTLECLGDKISPLRLDLLPDEVAVEEGRRARGPRVRDRHEAVVA
jgi:hypothetical protein